MPEGNPKDEYLDASANQRQFQTLRFAQLTVFLAISGFILNALLSPTLTLSDLGQYALKASGLMVSFLFWIHQERTMAYWNHFVRRAAELEGELGFQQYRTRPKSGLFSSFKAMRLFFLLAAAFWIGSFFWLI